MASFAIKLIKSIGTKFSTYFTFFLHPIQYLEVAQLHKLLVDLRLVRIQMIHETLFIDFLLIVVVRLLESIGRRIEEFLLIFSNFYFFATRFLLALFIF